MYFYAKKTLYLNITRQDESNDTKIYCIKLKKKKLFFGKRVPPYEIIFSNIIFGELFLHKSTKNY